MKHTKILKKALAAALSLTMTLQLGMSSLPESVFAAPLDMEHTIYSEKKITVNMERASINGRVFSGSEFDFCGNGSCYVNDTLNSGKISGNVQAVSQTDVRTVMPDYRNQLKNGVNYKNVFTEDKVHFNTNKYNISDSVMSAGDLWIDRTAFSGKGYIRAKNDIQYDAVKNEDSAELFLYSENGNITVQGTDITINGILYAPKGKVEINAKNLTVNGMIVAENVEINGTDFKMNSISDHDSSLVNFAPEIEFKDFEETYKQNRKITLDISDSFGLKDIDVSSLEWNFTADLPDDAACVKVDESTSTEITKNLIITKPGIYHAELSGKDNTGKSVKYYEVINVTEDIAPVAGFWKETDITGRDEDGKAEIKLEDTSYSPDGDTIGSRVWSVQFDSDNDGDFSDEKEEVFLVGNEKNAVYTADSVGKYKFKLSVAEQIDDTIPSLLTEESYLVADTSSAADGNFVTEVTNEAPESYSGISKAKNVDIVVTASNADLDDIDILNENIEEIKADLEERGYNVNLNTISASTLTAKDKFAWEEYDHKNYMDLYGTIYPDHITYEDNSVKMLGYHVNPFRDWLFVDDGIKSRRILSFDMRRDDNNWHSMIGGGFLFNTKIYDEKTDPDDPDSETIKKITGLAFIRTEGAFQLYKFDDVDIETFRNGGGASPIRSFSASDFPSDSDIYDILSQMKTDDKINIRLLVSEKTLTVYINDTLMLDNYVLPEQESGTGFGPVIFHKSHYCEQESYFVFSDIKMSTVNGSEFSEILEKNEWRDSAEHFVINLSKSKNYDLSDDQSVGCAAKSLIENDAALIGLGTAASKQQYDKVLRSADGIYADWYDVIKNKDILKNYILNSLSGINYDIGDTITTSDEIEYTNSYIDRENDPVGKQVWEYELDASVYENSTGKSGKYTIEEAPVSFSETGCYSIWSKLMDDPTNGNTSLDSYKKWSEKVKWTDRLFVHSKPSAEIKAKLSKAKEQKKYICELEFSAYDTDALSKENKGITKEKYEWKRVDESSWTNGTVPKIIDANQVYLQKYMVCDELGEWSSPCVEVISELEGDEVEPFSDDEPPTVVITVSDENPSLGDEILVSVAPDDNIGIKSVNTYVGGKAVSKFPGSFVYKCDRAGELVIRADCEDVSGNKGSDTKTVTVTDRRDLDPPEIIVDTKSDITVTDDTVVIKGTIKDPEFDSYKVSLTENGSEESRELLTSGEEVFDSEIVSFRYSEAGKYTVLIEACDKSSNRSYCKVDLKIEKNQLSSSNEKITKEKNTNTDYKQEKEDTPAEITFNTSSEKAEIGEIVTLEINADDKDGLVKLLIYKNDKQIADGPSEIKFTQAEPGVVVFKAVATDSKNRTYEKSFEIVFEDSSDHDFPSAEITSPENESKLSGKVNIEGSAFDETMMREYVLEYRKKDSGGYTPIAASYNEIRDGILGVWDTFLLEDGTYEIRVAVTDNGGNTSYAGACYQIENNRETDPADLENSLIIFDKPQPSVYADDTIRIEAKTDASVITGKYELTVRKKDDSGEPVFSKEGTVGNDCSISESVNSSMLDDGKYTVTLKVLKDDISVSEDTSVTVKHNRTAPAEQYTCRITSPEEMSELKSVSEIKGEISGKIFSDYKFEYSPAGENNFVVFDSGSTGKKSEVSGKFDTTLLENGYYDIRLTAYSDKYTAADMITVNVTGNMKIGNFTLSFEDMSFDVNGVPVNVIRTYDSRKKDYKGAFGYGWDVEYNNVSLTLSSKLSENWYQSPDTLSGRVPISSYQFMESKTHRINVDLGNGIRDEFAMVIDSPQKSVFQPAYQNINVKFIALNGSKSELESMDISSSDLMFDSASGILCTTDFDIFEPEQFLYTRNDGTKYYIDKNKGLTKVIALNGEIITFSKDSIQCSDKSANKSIRFTYDDRNRITEMTNSIGKTVKYEYDVFGDLVCVTDEAGNSTKFVYSDHYITEVYDPRGKLVSKNVYDENGRLIKTTDAAGKETTYDHDIEGRQEVITDRNGGVTLYIYDENGNVTSMTDPNGNTVTYEYDAHGNKTKMTDALGYETSYNYDESGLLLSMTDPEGNKVTNGYSSKGMITSINAMGIDILKLDYNDMGLTSSTTDALGNKTEYDYDSKGRLNSVTDSIGIFMNITYDERGNVKTATNGAGTVTEFTYDSEDNCISKKITYTSDGEEKVYTENYTYDIYGNAVKVIDSDKNEISKEYDCIGNLIKETDNKGRQTCYEYDYAGNVTEITYPDLSTESFTYDAEGNNLTATDRLRRKVTMEYDKVGNLLSKTYPNGLTETYLYDAAYNLLTITDVTGAETKYEYDKAGKNTAIIDALGNTVKFKYDSHSQISSVTDAKGNAVTYTYDDNGNRTKVTYADGTTSESAYDARGRLTSQKDQNGYITEYSYDGADRLISFSDAYGNITRYSYDEVGNLISVTDAAGHVTTYVYDNAGRAVKTTNAAGQTAEVSYDNTGNVLSATDFGGNTVEYAYDQYDRMISKTTADHTYSYSYKNDLLVSVTMDRKTTYFDYDNMYGLTKVRYPDGSYVEYEYDDYLRLTKVKTPYGTETYSYDALSRIERVVDKNGYATTYSYDANGNRSKIEYANGLTVTYSYDKLNRLVSEKILDKNNSTVASYIYSLGKSGERIKAEETDRTVEYTYDALYRLTGEKITDNEGKVTEYTYEYDEVSNRTAKTENGVRTEYEYNDLNQLTGETGVSYEYDAAGNLIGKTEGEKISAFTYNAENKMIRATVQEGNNVSVEEYEYDVFGNRTAKLTEEGKTYYLNDIGGSLTQVLAETDENGNLKCLYTRGEELISQEREGIVSVYLTDGHGSVRQLTDIEGNVTDTYVYDAWGNMISTEGETENSYLYCGEQFDNATGLYYLRARYMNPQTGTFTSMDTYPGSIFDPVSLHKYLYANADPVMNVDPSGYFTLGELSVRNVIDKILDSQTYKNYLKTYQKMKNVLNVVNIMCTIYDIGRQIMEAVLDPDSTAEDIIWAAARGIVTGVFINLMCKIKGLGPVLTKIFTAAGLGQQVQSIIHYTKEGKYDLAVTGTIELIIQLMSISQTCFTGDTLVSAEDGQKRIDEIEAGDKVWAYDIYTGKTELKEVLTVYVHDQDEILHLKTTAGDIDTTTNHPFYVMYKGWVAAGDLESGDEVYLIDGDTAVVTGCELEKLDEAIKVYNLEVEGYNTYFVGDDGVLVHNYNPNTPHDNQDIYVLYDDAGDIQYVGRSKNSDIRTQQHQLSDNRGHLHPYSVVKDIPYEAGRGLEQIGIEQYGTLNRNNPANNQINGINSESQWIDLFFNAAEKYKHLLLEAQTAIKNKVKN